MLVASSHVGGNFLSDHSTRYIFLPFVTRDFSRELALYQSELSSVLVSFLRLVVLFLSSIGSGFETERSVSPLVVGSVGKESMDSLITNLSVSAILDLTILLLSVCIICAGVTLVDLLSTADEFGLSSRSCISGR